MKCFNAGLGMPVVLVLVISVFLNVALLNCYNLFTDIKESISVVQSKRASLNK